MYAVACRDAISLVIVVSAGVQVAHVLRKLGRCNLDTNPVPLLKFVARRHGRWVQFVNTALFHEDFFIVAFPITRPNYRIVNVVCRSIRMHVNQLDREIGVFRIR